MSIMYLAKVNLTKGIFDVYDQKINIDTVISEIYNKLTDSVVYNTSANYNYRDSMGNRKKMLQKSQYGITELEKHEDFIITGKVLRTYDKPAEEVVNGKVKEIFAQENVSIYFYFVLHTTGFFDGRSCHKYLVSDTVCFQNNRILCCFSNVSFYK